MEFPSGVLGGVGDHPVAVIVEKLASGNHDEYRRPDGLGPRLCFTGVAERGSVRHSGEAATVSLFQQW